MPDPERSRVLDSRPLFCSVGLVTFAILTTSTAFTIIDATELRLRLAAYRTTAFGAAILDFFALAFIVILMVSRLFCSGGWIHRWILPWTGALLALAAGIISLNTLVLKKINPQDVSKSQEDAGARHLSRLNITAEFVVWALAVFAEMIFYSLIILQRTAKRERKNRRSFLPEKMQKTSPTKPTKSPKPSKSKKKKAPERPPTPPTPLRIIAPHYALPEASAPAPAFIQSPKDSRRNSWRDSLHSLHHVVRPMNSRTRLLVSSRHSSRQSFSRDSSVLSDTRSVATTKSYSDAFDTWDTSQVDVQIRETLSPSIPSRGRALETIPGSRPVSPAKALDGPFHPDTYQQSSSTVVLERPPTALSYASRHERPGTTQSNHSNFSKRTFIPVDSRPNSPAMSEAHIHPLFRTDSPTPPPGTSAGTTVTASPFGGQVIASPPAASRPFSRMRSESRASSRTMSRAPSPAFVTNSIDEHRALTSMSSYTGSKATSFDSRRSRSSSPVSRTMTPPIPEFILTASRETFRSTSSKETLR
jgi:hypothetical protein